MTAERFLVSIDLECLDNPQHKGLDLKTISYLNRVHAVVTPKTASTASIFVQRYFNECTIYLDVTALGDNLQKLVSFLNDGATKVFVTFEQLKAIVESHSFADLNRLILSLDSSTCEGEPGIAALKISSDLQNIIGKADVGVHVPRAYDWKLLDNIGYSSAMKGSPTRYISLHENIRDDYHHAIRHGHVPIVPALLLTVMPQNYSTSLMPVKDLILAAIHSDRPDGLYPTVVVNEHGQCLGLVYSSDQSIEEALRQGRGVYKSRKRDGVWVKGETSGDYQELISIDWDCDGDALRFTVRQKGDGKLNWSLAKPMLTKFDQAFAI